MTEQNNASYSALILRVTSGALFIAHGLLKVFVFTIPGTVAFFESLGLPGIFAYLTIAGEADRYLCRRHSNNCAAGR